MLENEDIDVKPFVRDPYIDVWFKSSYRHAYILPLYRYAGEHGSARFTCVHFEGSTVEIGTTSLDALDFRHYKEVPALTTLHKLEIELMHYKPEKHIYE